ncbi:AimR family lysis-lysogeny pheromone receptor [Virgibacillus flavescens]|uniref:AimR family lysis-lysogeny pheromone receptor n=1 Tax=Virgibacillus flavescens TaxID=1611422 RepID=UPI003D352BE1
MNTETVTESILSVANNGNLSLEHLIAMLSTQHDEHTVITLVRKLCLQSKKNDVMKKGMEFLYMNGFYEDLQLLIDRNKKSRNMSNNKWAVIYQLMLDRKLKKIKPLVVIHHAAELHSDDPELISIIEFAKASSYYEMRDFAKIGNFLEKQQKLYTSILDPFLISSLNFRLYQLLFFYHWCRNELIIARKYAFRVLNLTNNPRTRATINISLALTYTFDTYQQGMYHMEEAKKISLKHNLTRNLELINNCNIPFLSAHHKRVQGISTNEKSEQAHLEIAKGNLKRAENILIELPAYSPFQLYYLGVATNDKDLLHQSYSSFIEKNKDYFFCRLPIQALQEMGT